LIAVFISDNKEKTENSKKNYKNKRKPNSLLDKSGQTGLCDARTRALNTKRLTNLSIPANVVNIEVTVE
jgi:hypothetical protein